MAVGRLDRPQDGNNLALERVRGDANGVLLWDGEEFEGYSETTNGKTMYTTLKAIVRQGKTELLDHFALPENITLLITVLHDPFLNNLR